MNLIKFFFLLLVVLIKKITARLDFRSFEDENLNKDMASMARTVIVEAFSNQTVLVLKFYKEENEPVVEEMVNNVLRNVNLNHSTPIGFRIFDFHNLPKLWWNSPYNIFIIDSWESFKLFKSKFTITMFDYTGHYLLLWLEKEKTSEDFIKVFDLFWEMYVININIITPDDSQSGVAIYTYFPFQENSCEQINFRKLDARIEGDLNGRNLPHFPPKLFNLFGCPLRIATYDLTPMVMIKENKNGTKYLDGIEGKLMTSLSRRMNFQIQLVQPNCPGVRRGVLFENETATSGTQKLLLDNVVNITFGFMFISPLRLKCFGASNQYYTTKLQFIIPPQPLLSVFVRLLLPFDPYVWCLIVFVMAFCVTCRVIFHFRPQHEQVFVYGQRYKSHLIDLIALFLGGTAAKFPLRNFARSMLIIFIAYAFVIRSAYSGVSFKFLSKKIEHSPIDTIHELLKNNYSFYMIADSVEYMDNDVDLQGRYVIINDYDGMLDNMKKVGFKGALLTSQIHYLYRNRNLPVGEEKFKKTKDALMSINLGMFMKRESCILRPFNLQIQWLVESGLIEKWVTNFVGTEQKEISDSRFSPLGWAHIGGVIWMYTVALGFCMLVFIFENLYFYGKLGRAARVRN